MPDFIDQYFNGELNKAERASLGEELGNSEEAALRFMKEAEEAYQKFGLPEPQWTGPDELRRPAKKGLGWKLWAIGMLAIVVGVFAWWALKSKAPAVETQPILESPKAPMAEPVKKPKPAAHLRKAMAAVEPEPVAEAPVVKPVRKPKPITVAALPAKPFAATAPPPVVGMKPIDLQAEPHRTYSNLSVEIKWPVQRELIVKVLNAAGVEVTLLYQGPLDAGLWVFDWDGKFVDGRPAPPGQYQIEVKSGSMVQRKPIEIK